MPSRHMIEATPFGTCNFEMPVALAEHTIDRPSSGDFPNKEIVRVLNVRLLDESARKPSGAAVDKWQVMVRNPKDRNARGLELSGSS